MAMPFLLLYGAYFAWRFSYYGDLLPNTFYAKASDPSLERLARGASLLATAAGEAGLYPLLALALFAFIPSPRCRAVQLARLWAAVVLLGTFAYFAMIGGDFMAFFGPRLLLPALPALYVLACLGIIRLLPPPDLGRSAILGGMSTLLILYVLVYSWPARFSRLEGQALQIRAWSHLGTWLGDTTPRYATVATGAAGAMAYFSRRATYDMYGLTDRHIAHLRVPAAKGGPPAHEKYDPAYILEKRPDVIVSTDVDPSGTPVSAGLAIVAEEMAACYRLQAVVRSRRGAPSPPNAWIVYTERYSRDLFAQGYRTAVYVLRRGPEAESCPLSRVNSLAPTTR